MTISVENDVYTAVLEAQERISSHIYTTPLEYSHYLSAACGGGAKVYLKLESEQRSGSFKARGAFNKVMKSVEQAAHSDQTDAKWSIVTASTGNHALGCAHALKQTNQRGLLYLPTDCSESRLQSLKEFAEWCELVQEGDECVATETAAKRFAQENGIPYVSPYNDMDVLAGQGVIGYEIYKHLPSVDVCIVPCGGGGLISGVSGYLKAVKPSVQMIGAQPQASPQMVESVKAGRIVNLPTLDTLSNGTAGGIEEGSITFPYCQKYVDEWEAVTETEISTAVYDVLDRHHKVIEGAAGCGIATVHRKAKQLTGKTVVVVVCGSNISPAALSKIIADNAPVGYI